jgi:hypothetical protein
LTYTSEPPSSAIDTPGTACAWASSTTNCQIDHPRRPVPVGTLPALAPTATPPPTPQCLPHGLSRARRRRGPRARGYGCRGMSARLTAGRRSRPPAPRDRRLPWPLGSGP